jgi:hypothetical protein
MMSERNEEVLAGCMNLVLKVCDVLVLILGFDEDGFISCFLPNCSTAHCFREEELCLA